MSRLAGIDAVLFDVGGTLLRPEPSVGHVYAGVAAEFGLGTFAPDALNRRFAAAWKKRRDFDYRESSWHELVTATFGGDSGPRITVDCFRAIYARFRAASQWHVFDDVRPTLQKLRDRGLRLGVVSNWDERLRPLLDELRLAPWFDTLVISHEIGERKPSANLFLEAARQLGIAPRRIAHVGDSRAEDFEGAQRAGLMAYLIDRRQPTAPPILGSLSALCEAEEAGGPRR